MMQPMNKILFPLLACSALAMTGCQQFSKPQLPKSVLQEPAVSAEASNTNETSAASPSSTASPEQQQFALQGKIGVRTPQQSGSAFFTWVQEQQDFDIELSGILGVGKTQISGKPGQVTLNSAKTGLIRADSPEELLERATGWHAPITHLIHWVQAQPATASAQINKDSSGRSAQIIEDGWTADLSYADSAKLPNKLILKQALENGSENRITMIIQNR